MAMKRPAAAVKAEILTPTKPGEGKPHVTPEKAMPVEGKGSPAEHSKKRPPKPKASPKPKLSPLKVSWKALAKVKAKAKAAAAKAKPGEGCLPSPGTAAWKDVSYQLQQMEKKGDTRLKKSFNACQSQQAKRKWYYNKEKSRNKAGSKYFGFLPQEVHSGSWFFGLTALKQSCQPQNHTS